MRTKALLQICLLFGIYPYSLFAQENGIHIGVAVQNEKGEGQQFSNHVNTGEGFYLASLQLDLSSTIARLDRFQIQGSGFGAEPYGHFDLRFEQTGLWRADFRIDHRSFDGVAPNRLFPASGANWDLQRVKGNFEYDALRFMRLRIQLRQTERDGHRGQAFYGLGLPYAIRRNLDEVHQNYAIAIETKTLPVHLVLEQSWSIYKRNYHFEPSEGGQPLFEDGQNELVTADFAGEDKNDAPATRFSATYANARFEFAATGLIRQDRLRNERHETTIYELSGDVGRLGFAHDLNGNADRDTAMGRVRMGFAFAPKWIGRLIGNFRDWSTDTTSIGQELLIAEGRQSDLEIPQAVNERGFFDRAQSETGAEIEFRARRLSVVAGFTAASHDLQYLRTNDETVYDERRDADSLHFTLHWRPDKKFRLRAGYVEDDFDGYLFRTDPSAHDRLWGDLRWSPTETWQFSARYATESADRGDLLDNALDTSGFTATYRAQKGPSFYMSLGWVDLDSAVDIRYYLAEETVEGVSQYESSLFNAMFRLTWPITEKVRVDIGGSFYEDEAASAPLRFQSSDLRLSFSGPFSTDCSVFTERWDHDRQIGSENFDYEVNRFGVIVGRRF